MMISPEIPKTMVSIMVSVVRSGCGHPQYIGLNNCNDYILSHDHKLIWLNSASSWPTGVPVDVTEIL